MRFDTENKVIIESLTQPEAKVFIIFLESEIIRHKIDIEQARQLIQTVKEMYRL